MVSERPPVRFGVLGHWSMLVFSRCIRPTRVKCRVRQFADGTIVYFTIKPLVSAQSLEKDLHNIELRMRVVTRIKPDKRFVLGIHKKRNYLSTHFITPPADTQQMQKSWNHYQ